MECRNCGSIYERGAVKKNSDNEGEICEVCGEKLMPDEIVKTWKVKLIEKFEKPEFFSVNSGKKNGNRN